MSRWLGAYAAAVYLFLHLPLAILMAFSFNSSRFTVWEGASLNWYREVFADDAMMRATVNSLVVALVAAAVSTAIGTMAAYGLWKRRSASLAGTMYLTLVTPEIVLGVALLAFFQFAFRFVPMQLGLHTIILAHAGFSVAYVVIVVLARLRTFDATYEEAALDLGATPWQAFRWVTLPLLAPAIGAAAMLAFILSFDDYVITSMVAGVESQTLPMVIYAMARRGVSPVVNAVSTLIVVALGTLILVSERLQRR